MTPKEVKELLKAYIALSIAFSILLSGGIWRNGESITNSIIMGFVTVGIGFLLHELAHRKVARYFKKHAEFKANNAMLIIPVILSFFGLIIAAPGAVHTSGFTNRRQNGIIGISGPLTNLIIALIFLGIIFLSSGLVEKISFYGLFINAWLAVFNMIPLQGFDGQKVMQWSKTAYLITAIASVILAMTPELLRNFHII